MNYAQKVGLGFLSLLVGSLAAYQLGVPRALAATGEWLDVAHIKIGDVIYTDNQIDDNLNFKAADDSAFCIQSEIFNFKTGDFSETSKLDKAILKQYPASPATGCPSISIDDVAAYVSNLVLEDVTLTNVPNSQIFFHWVDMAQIESAFVTFYGRGGLFRLAAGTTDTFYLQTGDQCKSSIKKLSDTEAEFVGRISKPINGGCLESTPTKLLIGSTLFKDLAANTGTPQNYSTASNGGGDDSCESTGGVLAWIMCPIASALDAVTGFLDDQIQALLEIDSTKYNNPSLRKAWVQVRNIAYVVLIPIMLVMVIGTALGFEVFSAYTVKKALPRMVVAVIFITLSWYICTFLIHFFNVVGAGVLGIITSPFGDVPLSLKSMFEADIAAGGSTILAGGIGIVWLFSAGVASLGIILSSLLGIALILLIAFAVLLARQMFILALLLIAPLAILAWIFPGNDKLWKLWWGAFSKLLIMFPMIMGLIAIGRVFAKIVDDVPAEGGEVFVNALIKIFAFVIPYVFIPFTFKFAGGVFGNLAGMANDRGRGLFDRNKKYRQELRKEKKEAASNNMRWNPQGKLGRFNSLASWAASPMANSKIALGTVGGKKIIGEVNQKQVEHTNKLAQLFQQANLNDRAGKALGGFSDGQEFNNNLQAAKDRREISSDVGLRQVKTVKDLEYNAALLKAYGDDNDRLASNQLSSAAISGIVASSWTNPELQKGDISTAGLLASANQGFVERNQIAETAKRLTAANGGDVGFASQMASQLSLAAFKSGRLDMKPGYGVTIDPNTGEYQDALATTHPDGSALPPEIQARNVQKQADLVQTLKQHDFISAKPQSVKAMREGIKLLSDMYNAWPSYEALAMRQNVILGASEFSSSDPKSKAEWRRLADEMGLGRELDAHDAARRGRRGEGGGAPGGGDGGEEGQ
ncbi:hypothetical protein H0X10_04270 [Candidatus Saccharibacteria bacterium]|nr:hypothetical protein [Candidatus Saccharibacteria bacterium]